MPKPKNSTSIINTKLHALKEKRKQLDNWYYQYSNSSLFCGSKINISMTLPFVMPIAILLSTACVVATQKLLDNFEVSPGEVYLGALGSGLLLTTLSAWSTGDRIQKQYNDLDNSIKKAEEELESLQIQSNIAISPR
jgi:hypothetical protein